MSKNVLDLATRVDFFQHLDERGYCNATPFSITNRIEAAAFGWIEELLGASPNIMYGSLKRLNETSFHIKYLTMNWTKWNDGWIRGIKLSDVFVDNGVVTRGKVLTHHGNNDNGKVLNGRANSPVWVEYDFTTQSNLKMDWPSASYDPSPETPVADSDFDKERAIEWIVENYGARSFMDLRDTIFQNEFDRAMLLEATATS